MATLTDEQRRLVEAGATDVLIGREITIKLLPRPDGGLRVCSDDLPGLILSGPDQVIVLRSIGEAVVHLRRLQIANEI